MELVKTKLERHTQGKNRPEKIRLFAKQDPFIGSNEIRNEVFTSYDPKNVRLRLVASRLVEVKLYWRVSRKVSVLQNSKER